MAKTIDSIVKLSDDQSMKEIIALTPLDQIMPRSYASLIYCIPTQSTTPESQATTLTSLVIGLHETLTEIPFLSGIIREDDHGSGKAYIAPGPGILLRAKDLTSDPNLSYSKLQAARFPLSSLDGDVLAPVGVFPIEPAPPVMVAQANFVTDGLLLTVCFHHWSLDAAGMATVAKIWAENTRLSVGGRSGSKAEKTIVLPKEALSRGRLMGDSNPSTIDPNEKIKNYPQYKLVDPTPPSPPPSTKTEDPAPPPSLPPLTSAIFHFSTPSLTKLKSALSPPAPSESYISTYDALSALLWHSITKARQLPPSTSTSMLGFAVDGRRRLDHPLPSTYLGNVNIYASVKLPLTTLVPPNPNSDPPNTSPTLPPALSQISSEVRTAIQTLTPPHLHSLIALMASLPNITAFQPAFNSFLGPDLAITSWRDMGVIGVDWGWGKVQRVRIPGISKLVDGLCVVLPEEGEMGGGKGGLEVIVGLEDETMGRLMADERFMEFAVLQCI